MDYSIFKENERLGWDDRASVYDRATANATTQSIPALLAAARLFPGSKLLDVGCGPGYVSGAAAALNAEPKGVDFAEKMVDAAKRRYPNLVFEVGDAENLTEPSDTYDAVTSNIVLFHVTAPLKAIKEAYRVLKPNGYFAFSQWCAPSKSALYADFFDILTTYADMSKAEAAPDAFILSDPTQVADLFTAAGFTDFNSVTVPNILRARGSSFYDFFMQFGVRIPLILAKQDENVQNQIRRAVDRKFEKYRIADEIHVPMPSIIYSGRRP